MEGRYDSNRMPGNIRREDNVGILDKQAANEMAKRRAREQAELEQRQYESFVSQAYPYGLGQSMVRQAPVAPSVPQNVPRVVGHPELGRGMAAQMVGIGPGEEVVVDQGFNEAHPMMRGR